MVRKRPRVGIAETIMPLGRGSEPRVEEVIRKERRRQRRGLQAEDGRLYRKAKAGRKEREKKGASGRFFYEPETNAVDASVSIFCKGCVVIPM